MPIEVFVGLLASWLAVRFNVCTTTTILNCLVERFVFNPLNILVVRCFEYDEALNTLHHIAKSTFCSHDERKIQTILNFTSSKISHSMQSEIFITEHDICNLIAIIKLRGVLIKIFN